MGQTQTTPIKLPEAGREGPAGPPGQQGPPGDPLVLLTSPQFSDKLMSSTFYCPPDKDYCSIPKKAIVDFDFIFNKPVLAKAGMNINDNILLNSNGTTKFGSLAYTSTNQSAQSFKVGGLATSFYPVVFRDNSWSNGPYHLEISRANIHTDTQGAGSMIFVIEGHSSAWGSESQFFNYFYKTSGGTYDMFVADARNGFFDATIIIWLRGASTYFWRGTNGMVLEEPNTAGTTVTEKGGPATKATFPIATAIQPDFNLQVLDGVTTTGNRRGVYNIDSHLRTTGDIILKGNSSWTIEEMTNLMDPKDGNQLCFKQDGKVKMCVGGTRTLIWAGHQGDGRDRYMYFGDSTNTYGGPHDIGIRNKGTNTVWAGTL